MNDHLKRMQGDKSLDGENANSSNANSGEDECLVEVESAIKRLGGDEDLFAEFTTIYLEDAPQLLSAIESAIKRESGDDLMKNAHAFKGLVSNFGAAKCVETARHLESRGRNGELDGCADDFALLCELHDRVCEELKCHQEVD